MKLAWLEVKQVAHMSKDWRLSEWFAAGSEIFMGRTSIGYTRTPQAARYICRLHNIYLALANKAIVLQSEVEDLREVLSHGSDE